VLVAHHSAARFEAEERGLGDVLARFPEPDSDQLDVLTLIDMSTSPKGRRISVQERLAEILERYPDDDPVHRAVSRSVHTPTSQRAGSGMPLLRQRRGLGRCPRSVGP